MVASGYVLAGRARLPDRHGLDRWRARARERLHAAGSGGAFAGISEALAIGERGGISAAQRELLLATGTGHLVAISGLHVGLVAGFGFLLAIRV